MGYKNKNYYMILDIRFIGPKTSKTAIILN